MFVLLVLCVTVKKDVIILQRRLKEKMFGISPGAGSQSKDCIFR